MHYLSQLLSLVAEMIPYLLLGFLFAGMLHVLVPHKFYQKYLSQNNFRSVALASLFGVPLPLCSCGVIPTAMSLRKEGGSKAATTAFLCATPQTGIDSILATFSVFGLAFAVIRPIAALLSALVIGSIVCLVERKKEASSAEKSTIKTENTETIKQEGIGQKVMRALRYGFVEMIQDIGGHMMVGLLIAGLISVALPETWLVSLADRPLLEMLAVLLFAIPMYVCATGSIPIAAALMLKGLTPGAALVFLMAGPAANFASMLVINKALGKKTTAIFVGGIIVCALAFGLSIDYLMPTEWFSAIATKTCHASEISVFHWICLGIFALLLLHAFLLKKKHHTHCHCHEEACHEDACHEGTCENKGHHTEKVFLIEGMRCNHCRSNLEEALTKLPGVEKVSVSLEEKQAIISGPIDDAAVKQCIHDMGFEVNE